MITATAVETHPAAGAGPGGGRPWSAAIQWLAIIGPFFFLTYGFANWVASHRAHVPSVAFGWERGMPFLAWTIVPYWTSDFLYVLSLLICTTRRELDMHAKRLLAAQVISVACFLAFPLHCTFERPHTAGFFGWLFAVLLGFDKPFNQAPSLHVSLAVILWSRFRVHLTGYWRTAMGAWLVLIVFSTMTTYQHHFLDVPTGLLAGALAIALFRDQDSPAAERMPQQMRLATFYLSGCALAAAIAVKLGGLAWVLLWPGAAMLVVALAYAADWPGVFRLSIIRFIAAPYVLAAWINSRWWTRSHAAAHEIADGVWLGRAPLTSGPESPIPFRSIVNVAAELPVKPPQGASPGALRDVPMLDLVDPTGAQLRDGVAAIEELSAKRPTLVCCALGYSRSAATIAAWMVATGRADNFDEAEAAIRKHRPRVVLPPMAGALSARRV